MFEQPLYYAYFLGLASFVAGAAAHSSWQLKVKPALGIVLVLGLLGLFKTWGDYRSMEEDVYGERQDLQAVLALHRASLFGPWMELAAPSAFVGADAPVTAKLAFNEKVAHFAPAPEVMFRHVALLAEAGQNEAACRQFASAVRAWPHEAPDYAARLARLAQQQPRSHGALGACLLQTSPPSLR